MARMFQICERGHPCLCTYGTHAWKAMPAGNEHMIPRPPPEYLSPIHQRWKQTVSTGWKETCKQLGIEHWSEK